MDTKAAFEKWWKDEYSHLESSKYTDLVPHIKYGFFQAWTASRAAIEIELPEPNAHLIWIQAGYAPDDYWDDVEVSRSKEDKCCDGSDRYEVYAKWQLEEVFTSHGIRIKGKTE